MSTYLETGGKLSEHNLQIISDIAKEFAEDGELFWLGGDFQVGSSWLGELGWLKPSTGVFALETKEWALAHPKSRQPA